MMAYQLDESQVAYRVPVDFITRVNGIDNDGDTTYKFIDNNHCMIYNDNMICDCGEIGRHKRLKISRFTASRFDSGQSHQRMMPL